MQKKKLLQENIRNLIQRNDMKYEEQRKLLKLCQSNERRKMKMMMKEYKLLSAASI